MCLNVTYLESLRHGTKRSGLARIKPGTVSVLFSQNVFNRISSLQKYTHLIIIFSGTILRIPLLFTPLSFAIDEWRQTDTASIAYLFYANGHRLFYPQIFWGGSGPGYVETEFQIYPYLVSLLYNFWGENYWLGKIVSLLFSVFSWIMFYPLARKFLGETRAAKWALFFLVFSPLCLRYSVAFMPEATVMFFYVASLYFFVSWTKSSRKQHLYLTGLCTAFAILVKPTSIHVGLVFALFALSTMGVEVLKRREIWLSALIALAPGVLWYLHARNIYLTYGNTFGLLSGGDSKFGNLRSWLGLHLYWHLPYLDLKWILGFGAVALFLAGVAIALKRKELRLVVFGIVTVSFYYLIVSRYSHEEWGIQYHVYMLPFASFAVGLGASWVLNTYKGYARTGILGISMGVFTGATLFLFVQMLFTGYSNSYRCAGYVRELVPPNERIVVSTTSFAIEDGIPNNYQEPQIFYYSQRFGWSLPADRHTPEKLAEYHKLGADYFVMYSQDLLESNPLLDTYLQDNSTQMGPGLDKGCAIYRLRRPQQLN